MAKRLIRLTAPDAHVRADDAERDRAATELSRHCGEGRLSLDELSERLDAVYGAATRGELAAAFGDLPSLPREPARPRATRPLRSTVVVLLSLAAVALLATGVIEALGGESLVVLAAIIVVVTALLVAVMALAPVLVALAPVIALALAGRWLHRRLSPGHRRSALPWSGAGT